MRAAVLLLLLAALAACSNTRELPMTRSSDPTWQLNPGQWGNELTTAPTGPSLVGVAR